MSGGKLGVRTGEKMGERTGLGLGEATKVCSELLAQNDGSSCMLKEMG